MLPAPNSSRVTIEKEIARRPLKGTQAIRRGVAQPGSASALGAEGRGFESLRPDQFLQKYNSKLILSGRPFGREHMLCRSAQRHGHRLRLRGP